MWIDELVSTFEGKAVQVVRCIDGPNYNEELELTFSDGSTLAITFDANVDHSKCESEADAMDAGLDSQAAFVWGKWVRGLYDQAILQKIDTDDGLWEVPS
jgi:hypothetical protein